MLVAEDFIRLVGFARADERDWFRLLTGVQGVGARVALAILSALEPADLSRAIAAQDKASVARANGVGPKLAERIVRELKDKTGGIVLGPAAAAQAHPAGAGADAVSALLNLASAPPKPRPPSLPRTRNWDPARRSTPSFGWRCARRRSRMVTQLEPQPRMTDLHVRLPAALDAALQSRVAAGGYLDAPEYVRDLLRRDLGDNVEDRQWLKAMIDEGLASGICEKTRSKSWTRSWPKTRICVPRLTISSAARADLREIRIYSKAAFGAKVARSYIDGLREQFIAALLRDRLGRLETDLGEGIRSIGFRSHRIYYKAEPSGILIVRILHHAQNVRAAFEAEP